MLKSYKWLDGMEISVSTSSKSHIVQRFYNLEFTTRYFMHMKRWAAKIYSHISSDFLTHLSGFEYWQHGLCRQSRKEPKKTNLGNASILRDSVTPTPPNRALFLQFPSLFSKEGRRREPSDESTQSSGSELFKIRPKENIIKLIIVGFKFSRQ